MPKHWLFFLLLNPLFLVSQNLKEPWDLGCENSSNSIEMISCSYESFEISDSILIKLHNELTLKFEKDVENMKEMINGPEDSTYIKYYETSLKALEEYKKSMELFSEYRDKLVKVQSLRHEGGRMTSYFENNIGIMITVNQIEILRTLRDE